MMLGVLLGAWLAAQAPDFAPLDTSEPVGYYIAPGGDTTLAEWALAAWDRAAGGALRFHAVPESQALLRLRWVRDGDGRYGEMRSIRVGARRGAEVYVALSAATTPDPLLRDTIVYLTCLHETGHGLGLTHTADYADIMYFFGYGGDVREYFGRYRRKLGRRDDLKGNSGLSARDVERVRKLYGVGGGSPPGGAGWAR